MEHAICEKIFLVFAALSLISVYGAPPTPLGRRNLTEFEIRKELKRLNKPAIKSIKSEDGDIIDCVDVYKQPALDHPLLKNHTIQMRPSFYDKEKESTSKPLEQLWHKSGSCPEGTIPIRRTRRRDLLRAISSEGFGVEASLSQFESVKVNSEVDNYGGEAIINVWNMHVEPSESSSGAIFVGRRDSKDVISAGWMVSKSLFGDDLTRSFGYWESENGGCFNMLCSGFLQSTSKLALGTAIPPSTYGGEQRAMHVWIYWNSAAPGSWWLSINNEPVGYWPGSLFKSMNGKAQYIQWGGQVYRPTHGEAHSSTKMGSGHWPKEGFGKAAFFDKCSYYPPKNDKGLIPTTPYPYSSEISKSGCYDMADVSTVKGAPGRGLVRAGEKRQGVMKAAAVSESLQKQQMMRLSRRRLGGLGSSPPTCQSKCGDCWPCEPVLVPIHPDQEMPPEYYPEAWRCKCGDKLFMP